MSSILTKKTIEDVTNRFYSRFCGMDISKLRQGVHFVCSPEREEELKGYGCKYTLFLLRKNDLCIVSYAPKYAEFIEGLQGCGFDEIVGAANKKYPLTEKRLMIFHEETITQYGSARILQTEDYPLYETFFCTTKPNANPDGWLQEYFAEKAAKGYFAGYVSDGKLLSVCDAPDMPYMEEYIQHTGICTLKEERRKGYAQCTAALATHHLLENGICPQWEYDARNIASGKLAESIGYKEYGTAYILKE